MTPNQILVPSQELILSFMNRESQILTVIVLAVLYYLCPITLKLCSLIPTLTINTVNHVKDLVLSVNFWNLNVDKVIRRIKILNREFFLVVFIKRK